MQVFDYGVNWEEVKNAALPLLQKFTAHTNGANIKMRDSGLAWSYYSTDPEWGQTQAKQLHGELEVGYKCSSFTLVVFILSISQKWFCSKLF